MTLNPVLVCTLFCRVLRCQISFIGRRETYRPVVAVTLRPVVAVTLRPVVAVTLRSGPISNDCVLQLVVAQIFIEDHSVSVLHIRSVIHPCNPPLTRCCGCEASTLYTVWSATDHAFLRVEKNRPLTQ